MGSKSTTVSEMPEFQQEFLENTVLPYATDIAEREFTPYEGDRVSGMSPLQQQSLAGYGNLNMGGAQYGQASGIYGDLGGFQGEQAQAATLAPAAQLSGADIGAYMSPYTQNVIDASLRTLGGAQEQALNQQGAQASRAGAFGGSRHGIAEAETRKAYGQQASDLITNQMQQAYQQAQAGAMSDIAARNQFAQQQAQLQQQAGLANQQAALQAAGVRGQAAAGLGATAGQALQSQMAGLGAQMQAGEAGRTLSQAELDAQFAEFARQQDFPLTGLNALATAASGIPSGYGTTTQSSGGFGPMLGAIGSAGMGLGPRGFGMFGG